MAFPKFVSFCIQKCSNFMLWVSFLAGVITKNRCAEFRSLLLLERCEIHGKIDIFWAILTCIGNTLSQLFHAGGRSESTLVISFLCKVLRCRDSLPFPREKIDSGVLWHNFGIFTHTEVWVFFFFFFLNKCTITGINTIGTYWIVYKAERDTYKFTVYNFANLTISTFWSMYKTERQEVYLLL